MQTKPRFSPIRLVLFPYSGREQLTLKQSLRVIIVWALFFTAPMLFCTLFASVLSKTALSKAAFLLLIVFLTGIFIFGLSAWVVVWLSNKSAQLRNGQHDTQSSSTTGGK